MRKPNVSTHQEETEEASKAEEVSQCPNCGNESTEVLECPHCFKEGCEKCIMNAGRNCICTECDCEDDEDVG